MVRNGQNVWNPVVKKRYENGISPEIMPRRFFGELVDFIEVRIGVKPIREDRT